MRGKVLWTVGIFLAVGIAIGIYVLGRGTTANVPESDGTSPSATTLDSANTTTTEPTTEPTVVDGDVVKPIPEPAPITPDPGQDENPPVEEIGRAHV